MDNHQVAVPARMWAITMPMGRRGARYIYGDSISHTRSEAIRKHESVTGKWWPDLRRQGDRCVRVMVMEAQAHG